MENMENLIKDSRFLGGKFHSGTSRNPTWDIVVIRLQLLHLYRLVLASLAQVRRTWSRAAALYSNIENLCRTYIYISTLVTLHSDPDSPNQSDSQRGTRFHADGQ
jgi:hypothetical protein